MSSDLTWNAHIEEVIKNANKRLYFLVQLKRAKEPLKELVLFYTTCFRSVIDYDIPAFYHALPKYLKKELVRLEKRAIAIMNPGTHYNVASDVLNMRLIEDHHDLLCSRLFKSMMRNVNHKLAELLPPLHSSHHEKALATTTSAIKSTRFDGVCRSRSRSRFRSNALLAVSKQREIKFFKLNYM